MPLGIDIVPCRAARLCRLFGCSAKATMESGAMVFWISREGGRLKPAAFPWQDAVLRIGTPRSSTVPRSAADRPAQKKAKTVLALDRNGNVE